MIIGDSHCKGITTSVSESLGEKTDKESNLQIFSQNIRGLGKKKLMH
jgi:hypothetical protein